MPARPGPSLRRRSSSGRTPLTTAVARLDAPPARDTPATAQAELVADGVLSGPGVYRDALTAAEALELLALTEVVVRKARYGRQLTVRSARAAGASFAEIGRALGTTRQSPGKRTRPPRVDQWKRASSAKSTWTHANAAVRAGKWVVQCGE